MDAWINLSKPLGLSSQQTITRVKKKLRSLGLAKIKIGHAGTLDPMASGILPLALGQATKTISWVQDRGKSYIFDICFGITTDTLDQEGQIIETHNHIPSQEDIQKILTKFIGPINQSPPIFSAIKCKGERAYDLARKGTLTDLPERLVHSHNLQCHGPSPLDENQENPKIFRFELSCGKGFYVRSLARDLAKALGTCAYVTYLHRTSYGYFQEKEAISLAMLERITDNASLLAHLQPIATVLNDIMALVVGADEAQNIRQGRIMTTWSYDPALGYILALDEQSKPLAILTHDQGFWKVARGFYETHV